MPAFAPPQPVLAKRPAAQPERRICGHRRGTRMSASPMPAGAAPVGSDDALAEMVRRAQEVSTNEGGFKKRIALLGSTGSIGTQTLDIVRAAPDLFSVSTLAAGNNVDLVVEQAAEFQPEIVSVGDAARLPELREKLAAAGCKARAVAGADGIVSCAAETDSEVVVTGIVGCAGLLPTIAAINAGKDIALANKETLIAGGPVVVPLVHEKKVQMTAADSEHSAIFQCLQGAPSKALKKIILTASGGAFRDWSAADLQKATLADACTHPQWTMGRKITIDSASLYNKAAEVIEAHYLFGMDYDHIDAVIHRQSIVHSMVEFQDSSVLAQLGWADMRLPLLYSISWPYRVPMPYEPLDLVKIGSLTFEAVDREKYPNMDLAYAAGRMGGTATCVLNAANEAAVAMFEEEKIHFLDIARVNAAMLDQHKSEFVQNPSLEDIVHFDKVVRTYAREFVEAGNCAVVAS